MPVVFPRLPGALIAAALGLLHALSFAPWQLPWLQVLALAALFALALRAGSWRAAALFGFAFGMGWFGLGVSWVFISMHNYGGMPAVLAIAATGLFCAYLALYPALGLAAAQACAARPVLHALAALPAAWAASEWLRGTVLTGFPWVASGYAHSDGWLAGYAPVIGVYGLTLIAALVAGAVALWSRPLLAPRRARLAATMGAAILLGGGALLAGIVWTQPQGAPTRVKLVQGNVPQDLKFADGGLQRAAQTHARLLDGPKVDLAVLPESVYPVPLNDLPDEITQTLLDVTRRNGALVFGVFIEQPRGRYYNSAVGLSFAGGGSDGNARPQIQRYSKRHLVPFGEFIPWGFRWFVDLMNMPIGDQERGAPYQGPMDLAGQRIAVNICYEDLFGAEIIRAWDVPERAPTLLLNLSNLAWFDDSIALDQHLQISRLRALETGRPMLRATNTGATALVDARGQVAAALPHLTEGALVADVRGYVGTTPYVRFGDLPALVAIGLLLALALIGRRRR